MSSDIDIRPGALAEAPPAAPIQGTEEGNDAGSLLASAIAAEEGKPIGDGVEGASEPNAGAAPAIVAESTRAALAKDLRAIDDTAEDQMTDVHGKPTFTPEELKFLVDSAKKGKKATKEDKARRKDLLDRASKWRQRRRVELEERHRAELEAKIAEAKRASEVDFLVGLKGDELWELYNDAIGAIVDLGVMGADELEFNADERQALAAPTRDVLLKYPRIAHFVLLMNLPEVRLLRALRAIVKGKVKKFSEKRKELKAKEAAEAAKPALPGPGSGGKAAA